MDSTELILNAIRYKYRSEVVGQLRAQEPLKDFKPSRTLTLPLTAEGHILWDKETARLIVEVRSGLQSTPSQVLHVARVYTTEEIKAAHDVYSLAAYIVEGLQTQLVEVFLKMQAAKSPQMDLFKKD